MHLSSDTSSSGRWDSKPFRRGSDLNTFRFRDVHIQRTFIFKGRSDSKQLRFRQVQNRSGSETLKSAFHWKTSKASSWSTAALWQRKRSYSFLQKLIDSPTIYGQTQCLANIHSKVWFENGLISSTESLAFWISRLLAWAFGLSIGGDEFFGYSIESPLLSYPSGPLLSSPLLLHWLPHLFRSFASLGP